MRRFIPLLFIGVYFGVTACGRVAPSRTDAERVASTPSPSAVPEQSREAKPVAKIDACALLTNEEVGEVQGSPVTSTKSSERSAQGLVTVQCFYTATEFSRSVNVTITRRDLPANAPRGPRDVWRDTFGRYSKPESESGEEHDKPQGDSRNEEEREKEKKPPQRVEGVGEEAFWISGIGATLYVLKGEQFLRISIGGPENDEGKLEHAKTLAAKALERL